MRMVIGSTAALALVLFLGPGTLAGDGCSAVLWADGDGGDPCGCGRWGDGCGLLGRHCCGSGIEGLDRHFNCGCSGSYNYPVPPLYTYHWPGMFKQNLMTDYRSPWRFPPLKPYIDEQPAAQIPVSTIRSTSAGRSSGDAPRSGEIESMSSRLERRTHLR